MDRYNTLEDPACYAGTQVLINIADIKNQDDLDQFEQLMFQTRADEALPDGQFDLEHYSALHFHFFQDVYEWAGQLRTIRTGKGNNWFCYPEYIKSEMLRIFKELTSEEHLATLNDKKSFSERAAYYLSEINAVHPFREGNGRTQLVFLTLLVRNAGYRLDEDQLDVKAFLEAMIKSFNNDLAPLKLEIFNIISEA